VKYIFAGISAVSAGLTATVDPWFVVLAVFAGFAAIDSMLWNLAVNWSR
jgi:hypothetical protein